jgi:peptidoglycan/LPS O-acetylase OafA/YrhL
MGMGATDRFYLPALDGLRVVAFLGVFMNHAPPAWWLPPVVARAWIGVELFFVISSFLLFTLFRIEYERSGRIDVAKFFARRLLRLYPVMIAAPLLFMAANSRSLDVEGAWMQWLNIATFSDNLLLVRSPSRGIPFADHFWSLSFEFQVYAALPVIFYACVRLGRRRALWLLAALWAAGIAWRSSYAYAMAPHPTIYFAPWLRPDSVIAGMMLALAFDDIRGRPAFAAATFVVGVVGFVLTPSIFVAGPSQIPLFFFAAIACAALLWLALEFRWLGAFLAAPAMRYLGKISFGLYGLSRGRAGRGAMGPRRRPERGVQSRATRTLRPGRPCALDRIRHGELSRLRGLVSQVQGATRRRGEPAGLGHCSPGSGGDAANATLRAYSR